MSEPSPEMSTDRQALLAMLLQERGATKTGTNIPRRQETGPVPLSFAQQRLWFLEQFQPGNLIYNEQGIVHLQFPVDVAVLERTINEIVRRHEALRTRFVTIEGEPFQVIESEMEIPLRVVDLRSLPRADREAAATRLALKEGQQPFDLAQPPLLRTALIQTGLADYLFVLSVHHIVADGWSTQVFARELSTLYKAFARGSQSPLPELPIQYADYALWQRGRLQGERLERLQAYWQGQLADLPTLQLSTDRPRPALQGFQGNYITFHIPAPIADELRELSKAEDATLFMTLTAAYSILLARYSGQEDIVVGSPIANRNHVEIEPLIGFFVNSLVLRTDLDGNPTFREILRRVREVVVEALGHQELPFERLVEMLQIERDLSRTPLFQVTFQLHYPNGAFPRTSLGRGSDFEVKLGTAKYDLRLDILDLGQELLGRLEYRTDLFYDDTMARLIDHYQMLLTSIISNPDQRLWHLTLLPENEQRQYLSDWNDTSKAYEAKLSLASWFEDQSELTPNRIAVRADRDTLTYEALNRRANQLAHYLRAKGIQPNDLIAVCMERSTDLVVALLGILKAGGGYVPLDPAYPEERLAYMVRDSQSFALLTQAGLADGREWARGRVICLDRDWTEIAALPDDNPETWSQPEDVAYVIYTSGSTGQPKGVMISHRAISNHMHWMLGEFPLTEEDRVIQRTPMSFDASVWEFWAPLLAGAQLVLPKLEISSYSSDLAEALARHQITVLQVVPTLLRVLLDEAAFENCHSLRRVFCGGEALTVELFERFASESRAQLINLYGPTEATIDATFHICQEAGDKPTLPIGKPVANNVVYILDRYLNPMPIGAPGELHIGGAGLASGYLHRPELTAAKFIPNPFDDRPGSRLYKTGDLVRYLPDGTIEFLGRIDHQIKLRGFRIELGEIEAVLRDHPAIRQAVVVLWEDGPGEQRLVAYLVKESEYQAGHQQEDSRSSSQKLVPRLRRHLQRKLPAYMVPGTFVPVDALPLTPNGKVDRAALPPPDMTRPELEAKFMAPRTEIEEILTDIWADLLNLEQVGIQDNFFELGGHSLLAIQLLARLNDKLQADLSVRVIFEAPTVASLAQVVQASTTEPRGDIDEMDELIGLVEQLSDDELAAYLEETD